MLKKKLLAVAIILLFFVLYSINVFAAGKRIAVLPFNVPPENSSLQQFGMGTMETLTHALGSVKSLTLVNRGQIQNIISEISFQQSGFTTNETSVKAGNLTGVDIIITGSIQSSNGKLRINAHFTDVESGKITETFQVTGIDIFDLQDQLANQILKAQKIDITKSEKDKITKITKATGNEEAYKLYTNARFKSFDMTIKSITDAIDLYNRAIVIDPGYSLAITGKLEAHALLAFIAKEQGKEYITYQKDAENRFETAKKEGLDFSHLQSADFILRLLKGNKSEIEQAKKDIKEKDIRYYISLIDTIAGLHKKNKKNDEALGYYQEALQLQPQMSYIRNNMALLLKNMGETKKAVQEFEYIIKNDPNFIVAYINLGHTYYQNHETKKAQLIFEQGLKIAPENAIMISAMANNLQNQGREEEALQLLLKSLNNPVKNRQYSYVYSDLAHILSEKKNYTEAVKYFEMAMDLSPEDTYFYGELAKIYYKLGKTDKVNELYLKAEPAITEDPYLMADFGSFFVGNDNYTSGLNLLKKAVEIEPDNVYVLLKLAEAYKTANEYEKAIELFHKLKVMSPKNDLVYYYLAEIYKDQKLYDKAVNELRTMTVRKPESTIPYVDIGEIYMLAGNIAEALKSYEKAYSINNKSEIILKKLSEINVIEGHSYFRSNNLASAEVRFRKALFYTPGNPDIYNNLGVIYYTRKDYEKAIESYNQALVLDPKNANAYDNLGLVYHSQGLMEKAAEQYRKACDSGNTATCEWLKENIKN